MKKLLSLCLTLIFVLQLFTLAVSAAPALTIKVSMANLTEQKLKVEGQITNEPANENKLVTIVAVPNGIAVAETNVASFMVFTAAEADSQGKYSATVGFSMPDGLYDFYAIYDTAEAKATFSYVSPASFANYVRQIKNGTITKAQLYETAASYQNAITYDLTKLDTDKKKEIYEYRFDKSRALLAGATDVDIIEDFNEVLAFVAGECDFIEALEAIEYAGSYYNCIYNNKAYNKIDFTAYNMLSETQKDAVTNAFVNQTFNNADEVKAYWDAQVTAQAGAGGGLGGGAVAGGAGGGGAIGGVSGGPATEGNVNDRYNYGEVETEKEVVKAKFNDIYSVPWAATAITMLAEAGIVNGVAEGQFNPNGLVTREEFAKLLAVTLGIYDANATTDFVDAKGGWYTPYIASVKNAGLINGVGDGMFGVGRRITRQDMAVMIYNALKFKGATLSKEKTDFTDFDGIEDYAKDAVKYLAGEGIINGMDDGSYSPASNATRAQAAVLIYALKGRIE